ncbi:YiiX/YebB-like N1pC/P60 family cysteine hydrolase [Carboxylicivirga taeanensis]|uniref:YiiX/YebB-like N1pC/P60 family cysteine hydrolase n=1 Tax=Carboxylicivirga taeanensis TaxID=1416875 RepID=UPI003F6DEFCA
MSCQQPGRHPIYQSGDVLFRGYQNGSLSQAIDAVTQTDHNHHYTHMGLVEVADDTVWVWHAAPDKGVCKELLVEFCLEETDSVVVGHYRIKGLTAESITQALVFANQQWGQPYNYSYILEDEGFYCSEFVYEAFASDSVFTLNPMTFVDPQTGDFHQGWKHHYQELGVAIPEGEPGCNPNGMAASERLEFIGFIN